MNIVVNQIQAQIAHARENKRRQPFRYCRQLLENNLDSYFSSSDISMFLDTEVSGMDERPPKSPQRQSAMEFDPHCSE
jgi:hypothetical protein